MQKKWKKIVGSLALILATAIFWLPIYYFVIGAFKVRTNIVKFPLVINAEMFTLENFAYAIRKMKLFPGAGQHRVYHGGLAFAGDRVRLVGGLFARAHSPQGV